MFRRLIVATFFASLPAGLAVAADGANPIRDMLGDNATGVVVALFVFGLLFAGHNAHGAYERGQANIDETPTFPKYMMRKPVYYYGMIVFVAACLLAYFIIVVFYNDFLPLVAVVSQDLHATLSDLASEAGSSYPVVIIAAAGVFAAFLGYEHRWNVLLMLRTMIYRWAAVPRQAQDLSDSIRSVLKVPAEARRAMLNDPRLLHVHAEDFDKSRDTSDRMWAEISYMMHWLRAQEETGRYNTFFRERSFKWAEQEDGTSVRGEYRLLSGPYGRVKSGASDADLAAEQITRLDIHERIRRLHRNLRRMIACFLVYRNAKEKDLYADAERFGLPGGMAEEAGAPDRPGMIGVYMVTIFVTMLVSAFFTPTLYDWIAGVGRSGEELALSPATAPAGQFDYVHRWAMLSLLVNCVPLFMLMLYRYFNSLLMPGERHVRPAAYAYYAIFGCLMATVVLAIYAKFTNPSLAAMDLSTLFGNLWKWGIATAMFCAYFGYRSDVTLNVTNRRAEFYNRAVSAAGLTVVVCLVVAVIALSDNTLPQWAKDAGWTSAKFDAVVVMTMGALSMVLGLVISPGHVKVES